MRFKLLGRSGLRVSEVALGTMTFGEVWGWGASKDESRRIFDVYVEAGGNFVDTACNYTDGESETLVGEFVEPDRERFVVATKYTLTGRGDDPNAGGNHRKNMVQTLEASLRRLRTDYVDLLWLHMWDGTTPVEEVVRALDDLVSSGKVLYVGISDTPAWVVSQAVTLADLRGWSRFVALQGPYSLADRGVERELLPMARSLDLAFTPWGMLEGGALTGKYLSDSTDARRYESIGPKTTALAQEVVAVADELGVPPAQVAIAWVRAQPWQLVPIVGARSETQLRENLAALDVELEPEHVERLSEATGFRARLSARVPRVRARARAHLRRHVRADRRPSRRCAGRAECRGCLETLQRALEHGIAACEVLRGRQLDPHVRLDREPAISRATLALVVPARDVDHPTRLYEQHGHGVAIRLDTATGRLADHDRPRGALELGRKVACGGERRASDQEVEPAPAGSRPSTGRRSGARRRSCCPRHR